MPEAALADLVADPFSAFATGPFGSSVSASNFRSSGLPMLRGSNLSTAVGRRLIEDDLVFVDDSFRSSHPRAVAHEGDLIFTCWGTVGQIGLIDGRSTYDEYLVSNKQMRMTPDSSLAHSLFLYYYLSQPSMVAAVQDAAIGSSVPGFNLGQLKRIRVSVPDLSQQRAIAEVLGALDDKIAANAVVEQRALALLKATFENLDFDREPGASRCALDTILEINPRISAPAQSPATYLDMKNLPSRAATVRGWSQRPAKGGARFQNGDTLLARITPCLENGKVGHADFLGEGEVGVGSTEFIVLRSRPGVPAVLPYFFATSDRFREHAIRHMSGTTGRQRLAASDVSSYEIDLPSDKSLAAFASLASDVTPLLRRIVDESTRLAATRNELLPLLMSGRITVRDAKAMA